jgi:hypothetical protein
VANTGDELQTATHSYTLDNVVIKYNLEISVNKTKTMIINGKLNVRAEIAINNNIRKQVNSFNYLGNTIRISKNRDLDIKLNRLNHTCSTIRRSRKKKTRK